MIRYNADTNVVIMDLVDLEHCCFSHSTFDWELRAVGIEDKAARMPVALVVNFAGGHVITPDTDKDDLAKREAAGKALGQIIEEVLEEYADAWEVLATK